MVGLQPQGDADAFGQIVEIPAGAELFGHRIEELAAVTILGNLEDDEFDVA